MGHRLAFLIAVGLAVLIPSAPATVAPLDKGHFHDVFTDSFDCDGTPVQQDVDASGITDSTDRRHSS